MVKRRLAQGTNIIMLITPFFLLASTFIGGWLFRPGHAVSSMLGLSEAHHAVQRIVAVLLFMAAWNLQHWRRMAWFLCVLLLIISVSVSMAVPPHYLGIIGSVIEIVLLAILLFTRDLYVRPSQRTTVWRAALIASAIMIVVILNIVISAIWMYWHVTVTGRFMSAGQVALRVLRALIGDQPDTSPFYLVVYWHLMFVAFWVCVAICLGLVLKPATFGRLITRDDKSRARDLVRLYGQNTMAYLVLEDDKRLFFGADVEGVIAYGLIGDAIVVSGDPVCAPDNFTMLLAEFKAFCQAMGVDCIFLNTTDAFLPIYQSLGYGVTKCGEEAEVNLATYSTAGGAAMKLRQKVHRAQRAGVTVEEYKPTEHRNHEIEAGISRVSNEWLRDKKTGILEFAVGGNGLDDPADRRYFIARDADDAICAYNVLIPFVPQPGEQGYMVDVTRRQHTAPTGVTELLIVQGFDFLKADGVTTCSLGLAPLVHVLDKGDTADAHLLDLFYHRMNRFYGFKDLYLAKKKYAPTTWTPRYFVHSRRHLSPSLIYAAIAIQSPKGLRGFLENVVSSRAQD